MLNALWASGAIGAGEDLSPFRCQTIYWINKDVLTVGSLQTGFSEFLNAKLSDTKMHLEM